MHREEKSMLPSRGKDAQEGEKYASLKEKRTHREEKSMLPSKGKGRTGRRKVCFPQGGKAAE
jgi:hypothetical protein